MKPRKQPECPPKESFGSADGLAGTEVRLPESGRAEVYERPGVKLRHYRSGSGGRPGLVPLHGATDHAHDRQPLVAVATLRAPDHGVAAGFPI